MSFSTLAARLQYNGGNQLDRIKKNKLRSLQAALKNSYQSHMVRTPLGAAWPCLINNNTSGLKSDYDKKIISIEYAAEVGPGDVVECLDDGIHWMIYLPTLTETAYLLSEIIRCRYTLEVDGITYWVYFQGPTETDLRWFQKSGVNINELNLSGTIYIKKDKHTQDFFKRFTKIKIAGHTWEVQVTDSISVPGIIELEVQEYYDNFVEELPEIVQEGCHEIIGRESVEQDNSYGYMIRDSYVRPDYTWTVEGNPRVEIENVSEDGKQCTVKVHDGAIRGFKIIYGNKNSGYHMDVSIARECKGIVGPQTVYPYDIVDYKVPVAGDFWVETQLAKIIQQDDVSCKIEIETSKSGNFNLYFQPKDTDNTITLPVTIGSL